MMRPWVSVAVIAGCLGLVQAARAQNPAGPGGLPEPIPVCPDQGPNLVPGPISPLSAPPGPPDCLSLPNDGTGAFPCAEPVQSKDFYFHVGSQAWRRQGLGNGVLAILDPQNLDTGVPPVGSQPVLQRLSNVDPKFNPGVRATLGWLWCDNQTIEVTGYYTFLGNSNNAIQRPGQIDSFFTNPPLGFEGDNGMFLQADRLKTKFSSTLWSTEANYRYTDPAVAEVEVIAGVRYLDLDEKLSSRFDDDGVAFPLTNGLPDPTRVATYSVRTHNHFIAPQLGFEWDHSFTPFVTLGVGAKGAWGPNFVDLQRRLVRGDGFEGVNGHRTVTQFSHSYELSAFVDFHLLERAQLRFGYNAMWFLNMGNAVNQYNFNLKNSANAYKQNGNVFFQGPLVELQFLF